MKIEKIGIWSVRLSVWKMRNIGKFLSKYTDEFVEVTVTLNGEPIPVGVYRNGREEKNV